MAGCCGGGRARNVSYEITFKHDGSKRIVTPEEGGLVTARALLEASPQRGTIRTVPQARR